MDKKKGIAPNNVIRVQIPFDSIFRFYIEFLAPFHHLTSRETDLATEYLKERYKLSKVISDDVLLNKVLMGEETQKTIREACGLNAQHFQVLKIKLKQKKFIVDDKINPKLIPCIIEEKDNFQLLLLFELQRNDISENN